MLQSFRSLYQRFFSCISASSKSFSSSESIQRWQAFVHNLQGYYKGQTKRKNTRGLITQWDNVLIVMNYININNFTAKLSGYGVCTYRNKQWPCVIDMTVNHHSVKLNKINFVYNSSNIHQPLNVGQMMNSFNRLITCNMHEFEVEITNNSNTYVLNCDTAHGEIYKYASFNSIQRLLSS
jgi:hypothetical protein